MFFQYPTKEEKKVIIDVSKNSKPNLLDFYQLSGNKKNLDYLPTLVSVVKTT